MQISQLEIALGYSFRDQRLLQTALTHSSFANERRSPEIECYERLEFLGDSILGYITANHLYLAAPKLPEGQMTRLRSELVCEQSLVIAARELRLGEYLRLGRGEEVSGGRTRQSILADVVEAIIAAMYLDGGIAPAKSFVERFILIRATASASLDYKTRLQEIIQKDTGKTLTYKTLSESGPEHDKSFVSEAYVNDVPVGRGEGRSKKESEQAAAKTALEWYRETL